MIGLESGFLGMALLVLTPSVNPTTVGKTGDAPWLQTSLESSSTRFDSDSRKGQQKPLAVWQCVTGWYGEPFDGQPTANGETYDMYAITAAHPTLPLGSIVRIVNTGNHRSQIVRINDRGPYVGGRDYEVARRLGFDERGLAKVRLELLEVPLRPIMDHRN
jgi:rare lipoprotein A (peptidoglycan hydrolase)